MLRYIRKKLDGVLPGGTPGRCNFLIDVAIEKGMLIGVVRLRCRVMVDCGFRNVIRYEGML